MQERKNDTLTHTQLHKNRNTQSHTRTHKQARARRLVTMATASQRRECAATVSTNQVEAKEAEGGTWSV